MIGIIFLIFLGLLALGVPIFTCVGFSTLSVSFFDPTFTADAVFVFRNMVSGIDSYVLLAVPLFMLSSNIMARGGMSDMLFDFFSFFLGNSPSGLPITVVITCLFYGAICGSGPATVAAIGTMCIPLLTKLGYDREIVTPMIAVSGGLGVIIPPSIPFITYGLATGTSVGDLFIAGFLPGILIALFLIIYIKIYYKRVDTSQLTIQENVNRLRDIGFAKIFRRSFFALLAPIIILGGIYTGVVTPTEAACVAVVYAFLVCAFIFRSLNFRETVECLVETARMATPVMLILATCTVFGRMLALLNIPQILATAVANTFSSKVLVLLAINIFLLFVGMIMDTVPSILILAPILLPVVQQYGVDPVHFGIVMTVNLAIGFVTPPIGTNLFVANSLTGIPITCIAKNAVPYIAMFFLALLLITYVESISLFLPTLLK